MAKFNTIKGKCARVFRHNEIGGRKEDRVTLRYSPFLNQLKWAEVGFIQIHKRERERERGGEEVYTYIHTYIHTYMHR